MKEYGASFLMLLFASAVFAQQEGFRLNKQEYFENGGVNVMAQLGLNQQSLIMIHITALFDTKNIDYPFGQTKYFFLS